MNCVSPRDVFTEFEVKRTTKEFARTRDIAVRGVLLCSKCARACARSVVVDEVEHVVDNGSFGLRVGDGRTRSVS